MSNTSPLVSEQADFKLSKEGIFKPRMLPSMPMTRNETRKSGLCIALRKSLMVVDVRRAWGNIVKKTRFDGASNATKHAPDVHALACGPTNAGDLSLPDNRCNPHCQPLAFVFRASRTRDVSLVAIFPLVLIR